MSAAIQPAASDVAGTGGRHGRMGGRLSLSGHHARPREPRSSPVGPAVGHSAVFPTIGFYVVVSLLFTVFYFRSTIPWSGSDFSACITDFGPYPLYHDRFQFRVLAPLVARGLSHAIPLDPAWIFKGLTGLFVLGSLLAYREYLSNFIERRFASVFAPVIVYPMLWNYCLLNRIYFPFDVPGILLFIIGCHLIYRGNWSWYYFALVLATLNHEASCLLILIFWLWVRGTMRGARLHRHIWSQVAIAVAVKVVLRLALDGGLEEISWLHVIRGYLRFNAIVLVDMVTLQGSALKDWAKLGLAFGGLWMALPFLLRRMPRFLMMSLWSGVVLVVAMVCGGIVDEVRAYGQMIPVVLTPVLYCVATRLGGVRGRNETELT